MLMYNPRITISNIELLQGVWFSKVLFSAKQSQLNNKVSPAVLVNISVYFGKNFDQTPESMS